MKIKSNLIMFVLSLLIAQTCSSLGLTVRDLIDEYNRLFGVKWFSCQRTANDFYTAIDQNFQKANLECIAIKTGEPDPITKIDGHRIVTYTEDGNRIVVSTYPKDKRKLEYEVDERNYGFKTLHEVCESFVPGYRFILTYRKGFGFTFKSRETLMHECGHITSTNSDIWSRVGKNNSSYEKRYYNGRQWGLND